ncbi:MAG: PHP domain-containing protein [Clostridia bacterium]|nr:PHP domain-containing protein [Clostridia bacterium]
MKKQLLPQRAHVYKANMHMHTTVSDGRMTPEEVKAAYKERGYSIVAFTDHEVIVDQKALRDKDFLPITSYETAIGEEWADGVPNGKKTYHINLYAKTEGQVISPVFREATIWKRIEHIKEYITDEMRAVDYPHVYGVDEVNEIIRLANEAGFLVSYNHPVWSLQNYPDYAGLKGLWGVEVHNTGCARTGYPDTVQPFEDLLRQGERVYPLATDDAHALKDCFGGWLMVYADELEYGAVMSALENGDFYASTGPEIREVSLEDGILHVECSEAAAVFVSTERRDCKQVNAKDAPLTSADFDLTKYFADTSVGSRRWDPYLRVTVVDAHGNRAWTRAYFVE